MNIILLSGGSGKRLWPLSNDVRSKQFIKIFNGEDGERESMIQRMVRSIRRIDKDANVTIATAKSQISELISQLGSDVSISPEPVRRDTFAAIVLATAYLHDKLGVPEDEAVVVCPVDPYVEDDYFEALKKLYSLGEQGNANLTLMGIEPTYPSEKYGYIMPVSKDKVAKVSAFKEKPNEEKAKEYIAQGALWNAGIFSYKIGYVLKKAKELIDYKGYQNLYDHYDAVRKISFDYAIVEQESSIQVMRFGGSWKDLGTWNTLTESMGEDTLGNVILDNKCSNVKAINSLDIPLVCMGLKDLIVAASPEGILVSTPEASASIKPIVEKFDEPIRFEEKSWGDYHVIDVGPTSMTVKIKLKQGRSMAYHSHERRDEVWTIISGKGTVVVDEAIREIGPGDVVSLPKGSKHAIAAHSDMELIEVQIGEDICVEDKKKY